jgi:hypothetical protein
MNDFFSADYAIAPTNVPAVLLGLFLAFLGGQAIAWIYMYTHTGLSYSRSFVRSLVIIPVVVSLVMTVLSNNLVTAFGLMAVFAIVRFRNILRDTLDTSYILAVIVIGMACGTFKFATAIAGTGVLVVLLLYLWWTGFGTRLRYDFILNVHWTRPDSELAELAAVLGRHALKVIQASKRIPEGSSEVHVSYRLLRRDPGRVDELMTEVRSVQGVHKATCAVAEEESEV